MCSISPTTKPFCSTKARAVKLVSVLVPQPLASMLSPLGVASQASKALLMPSWSLSSCDAEQPLVSTNSLAAVTLQLSKASLTPSSSLSRVVLALLRLLLELLELLELLLLLLRLLLELLLTPLDIELAAMLLGAVELRDIELAAVLLGVLTVDVPALLG